MKTLEIKYENTTVKFNAPDNIPYGSPVVAIVDEEYYITNKYKECEYDSWFNNIKGYLNLGGFNGMLITECYQMFKTKYMGEYSENIFRKDLINEPTIFDGEFINKHLYDMLDRNTIITSNDSTYLCKVNEKNDLLFVEYNIIEEDFHFPISNSDSLYEKYRDVLLNPNYATECSNNLNPGLTWGNYTLERYGGYNKYIKLQMRNAMKEKKVYLLEMPPVNKYTNLIFDDNFEYDPYTITGERDIITHAMEKNKRRDMSNINTKCVPYLAYELVAEEYFSYLNIIEPKNLLHLTNLEGGGINYSYIAPRKFYSFSNIRHLV